MTVAAGSSIDVFVEDDADARVGKDISAKGYFQTKNAPVAMTTSFTNVLDASLTTTATANVRVLAQLESRCAGWCHFLG